MLPKSCRWPSVVEFGNCSILWLWGTSDTQTAPPPTGAGRELRRKERWPDPGRSPPHCVRVTACSWRNSPEHPVSG